MLSAACLSKPSSGMNACLGMWGVMLVSSKTCIRKLERRRYTIAPIFWFAAKCHCSAVDLHCSTSTGLTLPLFSAFPTAKA